MRSALGALGSSVAVVTLLWAPAVAAQDECHGDADCGAGRRCELPVSIDGCAEPPCDDVKPVIGDVGWCVLEALGHACASDADCGAGLICASYAVSADLPCAPDQPECGRDSGSGSASTERRCEYPPPEPLLCDADDHCAPPFACDSEQDAHACYYPDLTCENAADCPDSFECVRGADIASDCQECDKDDGGGEPVCRSVPCGPVPDQCSPKLIACDSDRDCPSEWLCREIGYDYQAVQWPDSVRGTHACVPGGTVQVAEGNYYLGGFSIADGVATANDLGGGAAQSAPAKGGERDDTTAAGSDHASDGDKAADDADGTTKSENSGCTIAQAGSGSAVELGWITLALIGLVLRRKRGSGSC